MSHITRQQRDDLRALAKVLDKVPEEKLNMGWWVTEIATGRTCDGDWASAKQCGFAGCGIGWAMAMPRFKRFKGRPLELALRLGCAKSDGGYNLCFNKAGAALFAGSRHVTPKQLANDIRRWVNHGELPVA